jgi:hypothetical protein
VGKAVKLLAISKGRLAQRGRPLSKCMLRQKTQKCYNSTALGTSNVWITRYIDICKCIDQDALCPIEIVLQLNRQLERRRGLANDPIVSGFDNDNKKSGMESKKKAPGNDIHVLRMIAVRVQSLSKTTSMISPKSQKPIHSTNL